MGLVLTGGPIGSSKRDELLLIDLTESNVDNEIQTFVKAWRGPGRLDLHTRTPVQKPSEWMTTADWVAIADSVRKLATDVGIRSIVVLHGTDTAAYTAAALSFLLVDLDATVVLTGANLPMTNLNSDAPTNVADAITASRSLPPGVYLSFAGQPGAPSTVHVGSTVRRSRADGQCFDSPNHGPVATVRDNKLSIEADLPERKALTSVHDFSAEVAFLTMHPGIDMETQAEALINAGKRGVVLKLYATATGPEKSGRDSLTKFAARCTAAGIVVVTAIEQFTHQRDVYLSGIAGTKEGALFAEDMIAETAYVKLCWALAQSDDPNHARDLFATPVAGESSVLTGIKAPTEG